MLVCQRKQQTNRLLTPYKTEADHGINVCLNKLLTATAKMSNGQRNYHDFMTVRKGLNLSSSPHAPTLPSRPFPCSSRKQEQVRTCRDCGRVIITQRCTVEGVIHEFVSSAGECFRLLPVPPN